MKLDVASVSRHLKIPFFLALGLLLLAIIGQHFDSAKVSDHPVESALYCHFTLAFLSPALLWAPNLSFMTESMQQVLLWTGVFAFWCLVFASIALIAKRGDRFWRMAVLHMLFFAVYILLGWYWNGFVQAMTP